MEADWKVDSQAAAGKVYSQGPSREKLRDKLFSCSLCAGCRYIAAEEVAPVPVKNGFIIYYYPMGLVNARLVGSQSYTVQGPIPWAA